VAELWEKREKESARAFNAFCIYRNLPPYERALEKCCQKLGKKWTGYHSQLKAWSSKFDWVKRAGAWDAYRDKQTEKQRLEDWKEFRENLAQYAKGLLSKGAQRMLQISNPEIPAIALSKWMLDSLKVMQEVGEGQDEKFIVEETQRMYIGGRDLVSDVIKRFTEDEVIDEQDE
jgi:hypothetical protein